MIYWFVEGVQQCGALWLWEDRGAGAEQWRRKYFYIANWIESYSNRWSLGGYPLTPPSVHYSKNSKTAMVVAIQCIAMAVYSTL